MKYLAKHLLATSAALFVFGVSQSATATILFGTSDSLSALVKIDTATDTLTPIPSFVPDSLVFDTNGNIIYSAIDAGQVRLYNTTTHSDTLLASGFNVPADLALEPGGGSVLVSEFGGGKIDRIDLTTLAVTTLTSPGGNPEGLAYDSSGRLFANLGVRDFGTDKFVAQLDPVTGAIINSSAGISSLDGLTFDPATGDLFASSLFGNCIAKVDPNSLAILGCISGVSNPDGLTSDAAGNVFIASRGDSHVYDLDVVTNAITQLTLVPGLDDLAPAAGLGAPPPQTPEPASVAVMGLGLAGFFAARRRAK